MATSNFGARVIGEEAARANRLARKKAADRYGPRVTGPIEQVRAEVSNPFLSAADANSDGRVTLAELEAKLTAEPDLMELAIAAEVKDGKPRKGALDIFRRLGPKLTPPPKPQGSITDPPVPPAAGMKIEDVVKALEANPAAVGDLLDAELGRVDGPRRAVLLKLRETEQSRPSEIGGPRPELLSDIDTTMTLVAESGDPDDTAAGAAPVE